MRNAAVPLATVDAYLDALTPEQRGPLQHLRQVILSAAPGATEGISYGIPTFKVKGKAVGHLAAASRHLSFHPGAVMDQFAAELAPWSTSKGTVRFTPETPLPDDLVRRIVRFNIERQGVG